MPLLDKLPDSAQILVGVVFMLLGVSFMYKAFLAMIRGKLFYWDGFLPFTLISPFTIHLPAGKNTLIKSTEALWVHLIMGPIFMFTSILFLAAGADLADLPGTNTLNTIVTGGKGGQALFFDKRQGYKFPILAKAVPHIMKLFQTQAGLKDNDALYHDNGSYNDAVGH